MPPGFATRFSGTLEGFEQAFIELRQALDAQALATPTRYKVELVFEEIVANILRHGARDGHALEVLVTLELGPDSIGLTFDDNGVAFDPRTPARPPPRSRDGQGGFGLMLVQRVAGSLGYVRTPEGRNRLSVTLPRVAAPDSRAP